MRSSSITATSIALLTLAAACSGSDPGLFGESSGTGSGGERGDGGSNGASQPTGSGASTSTSTSTPTSTSSSDGGAGPTSSVASTSSSSSDGGAGSVSSVGPTSTSSDVSSVDTVSSTATGPSCGNGVVDGNDLCDGSDLDGQTCATLGFGFGSLACTDGCTFDVSGCSRCGNGVIDGAEDCDDGDTNPGDGCDGTCNFEGTSCQVPIEVAIDRGEVVSFQTTNEAGMAAPGTCISAVGPGRVIRVVPTSDGFLRVWVRRDGTTFDSSLRIGYSCDDTFVCADSYDPFAQNGDPTTPGGEVGALAVEQDQEVFVFVEAWEADLVGTFEVELALTRGRCNEPVDVPVEDGSPEGIALWGFTGQQENGVTGTCGGAGRDATYRLVPIGGTTFLDQVQLDVVPSFPFNPVLHARTGVCGEILDQIACANSGGSGQGELIGGFEVSDEPAKTSWVFADSSAASSNGGYVLRVVPQTP